ncbi:phage tail protein [Neoasaia chiangmaiensis NBRC 101099]|uniref:Uncharacterized protein n=1 Tax=Neoasaia chiangmaiensis TaxID=320497 RepID=A0A1U9KQ35_9PROT|nr:hypothetical protein [Neoasaia chiangmaiensis]AQS87903.1 hypothetical protein A0U93_08075 [Neoasaia chiangmaiensis]GBR39137.1 phage tail protein [Neoasaia chiangmaiensis NBRC 101099]GEN15551.1 hypothetical protein NCH01_19820 [Neoasaia chiangmaiensis]
MNAIAHVMGADLTLGAAGGLAVVSGAEAVRQRLLRRLCTNAGDYIWQMDYGAGLPSMVGDPAVVAMIRGVVVAQMALEDGVDRTRPVDVTVVPDADRIVRCSIVYTDVATQEEQSMDIAF